MSRLYEYYDVTGGANVITSALPDVFHYDPSSFYNYAQDNLSVTSLETRFNTLAQGLGFPGSSGTYSGVTFLVSSTATPDPDNGVYSSVQAAIDDLPKVINYPVNIEVADYGNLGSLSCVGFKCEGDGAVQIHVLNYGSTNDATVEGVAEATGEGGFLYPVSSITASALVTQIKGVQDYRTSHTLWDPASWKSNCRAFTQISPDSQSEVQTISFVASWQANDWALSSVTSALIVENYLAAAASFDTTVSQDINPSTGNSDVALVRYRTYPKVGDRATSLMFGAYFSGINIRDCDKFKLKGVLVDGNVQRNSGATYYATYGKAGECEVGLNIENSQVLLEDVAVARAGEGIRVTNSKVCSTKSLVVYRVYDKSGQTVTVTDSDRGNGIHLINSDLIFDTESSALNGRYMRTFTGGCGVGIKAVNSLVGGGSRDTTHTSTYAKNAGGSDTRTSHLQSSRNVLGYEFLNSFLDYDGRLGSFLNMSGVKAVNSQLTLPMFSVDDNGEYGFKLDNSVLYYGKNADSINAFGGVSANSAGIPFFQCDFNGVNAYILNNSHVGVSVDVDSYSAVGSWGGNESTGVSNEVSSGSIMRNHGEDAAGIMPPGIIINNNSAAFLIGLGYLGMTGTETQKGACASVTRNSTLKLLGFGNRWTTVTSHKTFADNATKLKRNWTSTAFYAGDNSRIEFYGPTKISRYGVDCLSENGSTAYFGPPNETDYLGFSKYGLDSSANHTKVQLHSTRACLVANNESRIKLFGMGVSADASSTFPHAGANSRLYAATNGGYVQFLPNGFTEAVSSIDTSAVVEGTNLERFSRTAGLLTDAEMLIDQALGSTGGMCIRVLDNSDVDVELVDFKFGVAASSVSGVMYNFNGTGEEFIDNMENYTPLSETTKICWIADLCCDCGPTTTTSLPTTSFIPTSSPTTTPTTTSTTTTTPTTTTTTTTPTTTTTTTTPTTTTTTTTHDNNYDNYSNHNNYDNYSNHNNYYDYSNHNNHNNYSNHNNHNNYSNHDNYYNYSNHDNYYDYSNHNNHNNYSNHDNYYNYSNHDNYYNYSNHDNYYNYSNHNNYDNYSNHNNYDNYSNHNNYDNYSNHNNYDNYSNHNNHNNYSNHDNYYNYSNHNNYDNYSLYSPYNHNNSNHDYSNHDYSNNYNSNHDYSNHDYSNNYNSNNHPYNKPNHYNPND